MAEILYPLNDEPAFPGGPILFMAGPVAGAPPWQRQAFNILLREGPPNLTVADPRGNYTGEPPFSYEEQIAWETKWLTKAGKGYNGVIMFWLAAQRDEIGNECYGQTSRFELGEWFGRAQFIGDKGMPKIVVGIEEGFTNTRYIRCRIEDLLRDHIPILDSLEDTCLAAIAKLKESELDIPEGECL